MNEWETVLGDDLRPDAYGPEDCVVPETELRTAEASRDFWERRCQLFKGKYLAHARTMQEWHDRAVAAGFDGVPDMLGVLKRLPINPDAQ